MSDSPKFYYDKNNSEEDEFQTSSEILAPTLSSESCSETNSDSSSESESKNSRSSRSSRSSKSSSSSKFSTKSESFKKKPISFLLNNKSIEMEIDFDNSYVRIVMHYLFGIGAGFLAFGCLGAVLGGLLGFLIGLLINILSIPFVLFYRMKDSHKHEMGMFIGIVIGGLGVGIVGSLFGFLLSTVILPITLLMNCCKKQKQT